MTSYTSKGHSINCNSVTLGGIYANTSSSINIRHSDPLKKILINGIEPSAGGGGGGVTDPLNLNNINAAVAMTTPSITPPAAGGGLVIKANELSKPVGVGETLNISASTIETVDGDISTSGTGSVRVQGTGFISCSTTITANGNISTGAAADINSGHDFIFNGQDIYKSYPGIVPPIANKTYKDYKGLVATGDNNTFTGTNKFRNTVSIQALNQDIPAVYVDKISLNTDGNIQCNEINNNTLLKSNSIICENGPADSQKVMARQYHFRPDSLESTGWVFSQKPPDNPAIPEDNYLMLQNTQATGSLNLVKSSFDPLNPTPFDIILDPQNGQVKTAASFDAPQVNFRKNAVDNWSISQPAAGDVAEGTLIARAPNTLGSFNIFDSASSPWAQFSSTGTTLPKPTTINNTLNVNGNTTLGNTNSLLFGAYVFRPVELVFNITAATLDANPPALFNSLTTNFTRTNDGASVTLNSLGESVYHLSIDATSSTGGTVGSSRFMCNFPYMVSANAAGQFVFSGNFCMNTTPPAGFTTPVIEGDGTGGPAGSTNYSFAFPSVTGTETYNCTIRITALNH